MLSMECSHECVPTDIPTDVSILVQLSSLNTSLDTPPLNVPTDFVCVVDASGDNLARVKCCLRRLVDFIRKRNCQDRISIITDGTLNLHLTSNIDAITRCIDSIDSFTKPTKHLDILLHTAIDRLDVRRMSSSDVEYSRVFLFTDGIYTRTREESSAMARIITSINYTIDVFTFDDHSKHYMGRGQYVNIAGESFESFDKACETIANISATDVYLNIPCQDSKNIYGCNRSSVGCRVLYISALMRSETRTVLVELRVPASSVDYRFMVYATHNQGCVERNLIIKRQNYSQFNFKALESIHQEVILHTFLRALQAAVETPSSCLPAIDSAIAKIQSTWLCMYLMEMRKFYI